MVSFCAYFFAFDQSSISYSKLMQNATHKKKTATRILNKGIIDDLLRNGRVTRIVLKIFVKASS